MANKPRRNSLQQLAKAARLARETMKVAEKNYGAAREILEESLSPQLFEVLILVIEQPRHLAGIRSVDVAEAMKISDSAAATALKELYDLGLVNRTLHPSSKKLNGLPMFAYSIRP